MTNRFKETLIAIVTFLGGLYFFLYFLLPKEIGGVEFGAYNDQISQGVQVIGVMAIGLGIISIFRVHGGQIVKCGKNWPNSLALILGLVVMVFVESVDMVNSEKNVGVRSVFDGLVRYSESLLKDSVVPDRDLAAEARRLGLIRERLTGLRLDATSGKNPFLNVTTLAGDEKELGEQFLRQLGQALVAADGAQRLYRADSTNGPEKSELEAALQQLISEIKRAASAAQDVATAHYRRTAAKKISNFLSQGLLIPLGSSMFALLAFYIASAAYRSFKLRSLEATMMMIPAVLVILGQIPHGPMYISEHLPAVRLWLLQNISTPAFRAIFFGASIAGLAMAVRMWLSLERGPLSSDDQGGN